MLGCTGTFEANPHIAQAQSTAPGSFPDEDDEDDYSTGARSIYVHGHAASRLFKAPEQDMIPVCVAGTTMQGVVLALAPFHNSCNYGKFCDVKYIMSNCKRYPCFEAQGCPVGHLACLMFAIVGNQG